MSNVRRTSAPRTPSPIDGLSGIGSRAPIDAAHPFVAPTDEAGRLSDLTCDAARRVFRVVPEALSAAAVVAGDRRFAVGYQTGLAGHSAPPVARGGDALEPRCRLSRRASPAHESLTPDASRVPPSASSTSAPIGALAARRARPLPGHRVPAAGAHALEQAPRDLRFLNSMSVIRVSMALPNSSC